MLPITACLFPCSHLEKHLDCYGCFQGILSQALGSSQEGVFVSTYPALACLLLLVLLKPSKDRVGALALSQWGTSWAPGVTHEDLCPVDLPTPHPNQISQGCSRVSSEKLGPGSSRTLVDSGDAQFHHLQTNIWNFSSICI